MRFLTALLCTLLLASSALAADLPSKQAPVSVGYPSPTGHGFYGGLGTFVDISSSTVDVGGVSTNMFSSGAALEALVGYQYNLPGVQFGFTEVAVSYTNIGGTTSCLAGVLDCSVSDPWGFSIGTAVGFNWTYAFQWIPAVGGLFNGNQPSSLLPSGLTPTASVPYAGVWADINDQHGSVSVGGTTLGSSSTWQVTPELRLGLLNYLPSGGGVLDTHVGYQFSDTSFNIVPGVVTAKKGGTLRIGMDYKF